MTHFIDVAASKKLNTPSKKKVVKKHTIRVGALVELKTGVRLWVVKHTRDRDQFPLYSLGTNVGFEGCVHCYKESMLKQITSG